MAKHSIDGCKKSKYAHSHLMKNNGDLIKNVMIQNAKKRARESTDAIPKIIKEVEAQYLTVHNADEVDWNRGHVKQMLYRDRAKKFPNIPKTLDEYDSSLGITKLEDGGIYFFVYLFLKIGKKCGNSGGPGGIAPW